MRVPSPWLPDPLLGRRIGEGYEFPLKVISIIHGLIGHVLSGP